MTLRIGRREILAAAMIAVLAPGAGAQVSDSVARIRIEQMSVCPTVLRRDDGPVEGKSLTVGPFFLSAGSRQVGFALTVATPLGGALGPMALVNAMSITEGQARYALNHGLTIIGDDSIRLAPITSYNDQSPRDGIHFESVDARLTVNEVERMSAAKKIHINVGDDSFELKPGQVQALRALSRELQHPTGAARIETGCIGPAPDEVIASWADPDGSQKNSNTATANGPAYFEFQVEKPATPMGGAHADYPSVLRGARVEGSVVAQFVVLENGSADLATYHVLKSSHELFAASAREAVGRMRFNPAEIAGKKVRQIVQLPFEFKLSGSARTKTDSAEQRPVLLRRAGSSDVIAVPRNASAWSTIQISPSDSARLPPGVYLPSQVDKPVRSPDGTAVTTELPPQLAAVFSGYAVLEFVANSDGTIDNSTFKVLRATSREIAHIYSRGAPGMFFIPAELHGKKVRQLVVVAVPVSLEGL